MWVLEAWICAQKGRRRNIGKLQLIWRGDSAVWKYHKRLNIWESTRPPHRRKPTRSQLYLVDRTRRNERHMKESRPSLSSKWGWPISTRHAFRSCTIRKNWTSCRKRQGRLKRYSVRWTRRLTISWMKRPRHNTGRRKEYSDGRRKEVGNGSSRWVQTISACDCHTFGQSGTQC